MLVGAWRMAIPRASLLALAACTAAEAPQEAAAPPPTPITTALVAEQPIATAITATGPVAYERQETLSFKVGGVVRALSVDEGDRVRPGQLLAALDPTDVATVAAQAVGATEQAAAGVAQARAVLVQAQNDLTRAETLVERGFASPARLDAARATVAAARASVEAAQAATITARGASARAQFDQSQARIIAPSAAVVLVRHSERNETVAAGQPILTLGDAGSGLILTAPLADRDMARVRIGDRADVRLAALGQAPIAATVSEIAAMADPRTGAFDVELRLAAAPPGVAAGMLGAALIQASGVGAARGLIIPSQALIQARGDEADVFVFNPRSGQVSRRRITLGPLTATGVVVASGLAPGERVAVGGAAYLRDGMTAVEAAPAPAATKPKP
jgi:RND family efflux transporter MFP subunit